MDLKALIAKMDQIEAKQILNESVKMPAEKLTKVVVESVTVNEGFKSSIAKALLVEFGLAEAEEFKFSPEQEKWLGGANRQDPYIINRMPGAKPPVTYFTDPEDQAIAKQMNFGQSNLNSLKSMVGMKPGDAQTFADPTTAKPAGGAATKPAAPAAPAAPTGTTAQGDDDGNTTITKPDGTTQVVGPDGNAIPPGGGKENPAAPTTAAAPSAATKPAASGDTARPGMRPGGTAAVYDQQKALVAQGAKIATDGIMGPKTQAAIKQFGGGATKPAANASDATIDPAKLKRFKELLAKSGAK